MLKANGTGSSLLTVNSRENGKPQETPQANEILNSPPLTVSGPGANPDNAGPQPLAKIPSHPRLLQRTRRTFLPRKELRRQPHRRHRLPGDRCQASAVAESGDVKLMRYDVPGTLGC